MASWPPKVLLTVLDRVPPCPAARTAARCDQLSSAFTRKSYDDHTSAGGVAFLCVCQVLLSCRLQTTSRPAKLAEMELLSL